MRFIRCLRSGWVNYGRQKWGENGIDDLNLHSSHILYQLANHRIFLTYVMMFQPCLIHRFLAVNIVRVKLL